MRKEHILRYARRGAERYAMIEEIFLSGMRRAILLVVTPSYAFRDISYMIYIFKIMSLYYFMRDARILISPRYFQIDIKIRGARYSFLYGAKRFYIRKSSARKRCFCFMAIRLLAPARDGAARAKMRDMKMIWRYKKMLLTTPQRLFLCAFIRGTQIRYEDIFSLLTYMRFSSYDVSHHAFLHRYILPSFSFSIYLLYYYIWFAFRDISWRARRHVYTTSRKIFSPISDLFHAIISILYDIHMLFLSPIFLPLSRHVWWWYMVKMLPMLLRLREKPAKIWWKILFFIFLQDIWYAAMPLFDILFLLWCRFFILFSSLFFWAFRRDIYIIFIKIYAYARYMPFSPWPFIILFFFSIL